MLQLLNINQETQREKSVVFTPTFALFFFFFDVPRFILFFLFPLLFLTAFKILFFVFSFQNFEYDVLCRFLGLFLFEDCSSSWVYMFIYFAKFGRGGFILMLHIFVYIYVYIHFLYDPYSWYLGYFISERFLFFSIFFKFSKQSFYIFLLKCFDLFLFWVSAFMIWSFMSYMQMF